MKSIKLPESELAEMKQFYQEEHGRITRRLQHIKAVLDRLGIEIQEENLTDPIVLQGVASTSDSPPSPAVSKRKKKSGRKPKWEMLIMKRLRQLDKPVTYDELTDEIMAFSKLPEIKKRSTKQAIINVIFRLRSQDRKLDTFSIGTREKYIALKGWFVKPGEIKKEYAAKIAKLPQKTKPKTGKRGRPRKAPSA